MAAKFRTVVKHSYVNGRNKGQARVKAHVRYIQFRPGKDKDDESRSFFNDREDGISSREVMQAIDRQNDRGVIAHKLILSPGVAESDIKEYCREVMDELCSKKGLDLEWYAVRHDNTNHSHCHIVVMGVDRNGRKVKITREDYAEVKEAGDRYLHRNRHLDKVREPEKEKDRERTVVDRFFDAVKAAGREFAREIRGEKKSEARETRYQRYARQQEETRKEEVEALGEAPDYDLMSQTREKAEDREKKREERAWKSYSKPIMIRYGGDELGLDPVEFNWRTDIALLRDLERDYKAGREDVCSSMTNQDLKRLDRWIKDQIRDEKDLDRYAKSVKQIDFKMSEEDAFAVRASSSLEELKAVEDLEARGLIFLQPAEARALEKWISEREVDQPINIKVESRPQPVVCDQRDSREILQFLADEYAAGEKWLRDQMTDREYSRLKGWIKKKGKDEGKEKDTD